jgi:3-oxoacyl-[acyl-carrier-protein] synthase II
MATPQGGSSPRRRVVITGQGVVTALGQAVETLWQALLDGRSGVDYIRQFDSHAFPVRIGSEVDLSQVRLTNVDGLEAYLSRPVQFGIAALEHAWADAGLRDDAIDPSRSGVCIGALNFPVLEHEVVARRAALGDGYKVVRYLDLCRRMPELLAQRDIGAVATLLSMRHQLKGISMSIQTACASATQAIGEAYRMIRRGEADLMVSGGTDSMLSAICVTGFTLIGVASAFTGEPARASRPFDRKRDGLVMGEGSGIVILEELEHARRRNAPIHAEIIGYGASCDGYRFTDSHPEGLGPIRCMRAALADAELAPEAVDYVNAHGTATPQNDRVETLALKQVFGDHARSLPISSTKSQLGHLICAAGGVELIVTTMALERGVLPPTINYEYPDPACDLDYVPNEPRDAPIRIALSNSFGFGGQNGSVLVARWDETDR